MMTKQRWHMHFYISMCLKGPNDLDVRNLAQRGLLSKALKPPPLHHTGQSGDREMAGSTVQSILT